MTIIPQNKAKLSPEKSPVVKRQILGHEESE